MNFRIADTFTDSLSKLTGEEQKAIKTTAFDLQLNPENPGFSFHKLDRAKDKSFWSVRVNTDIRIIVHKTQNSLLLCYVDHHDKAYAWAERRKLETHPKTGAAQIVEIRERVEEVVVPKYIESLIAKPAKPLLFTKYSDDQLLGYGVPQEWLGDIRSADEDSILELADHLPAEAAEAVLDLAVGKTPSVAEYAEPVTDPFQHPDALRRFRIMANAEELAQALDFPWDKWTVFLHPAQRQWVEREFKGPARVSGSAGTGKTIVALHRAVYLTRRYPEARVLLTSFSPTLANALRNKVKRLISQEPRLAERLEVHALDSIGQRLYESNFGKCQLATADLIRELLSTASKQVEGNKFSQTFLFSEWQQVVDAWQLDSWEAYRDVKRLGRKTRLPEAQRQQLWAVFEQVITALNARHLLTHAAVFTQLAQHFSKQKRFPFDFAVIDEAQDVSVAQLRFLSALGGDRANALFFAGDLGQRIFQQAFSWKALGVDIRGRSRTLHINYRTSHQIRMQADHLLGPELSDVDGNTEDRRSTVSVFNGPQPAIQLLETAEGEIESVGQWLAKLASEGIKPHEIGVFVRSENELDRAIAAVEHSQLPFKILDEHVETVSGYVSVCTMHLAKGLEFRAVVVMACDDEVIPSQERIETVTDDADLEEVYNTERHLLYVACTRARDHLLVTSGDVPSEFLDDLRQVNLMCLSAE
ncbi:3'-5' exonuclease [Methylobacter sp. sgz302048]|uniref:3'-5' exonuclease n=1 Tax=Methylobacter sp. sgz302048 TaxID=3455945 RepID=UPI003F9F5701